MRTLLILLLLTVPAAGAECFHKAGSGSGWSWRQVDGKRCWYKGERSIARSKLRWLHPRKDNTEAELLRGVWPPLGKE